MREQGRTRGLHRRVEPPPPRLPRLRVRLLWRLLGRVRVRVRAGLCLPPRPKKPAPARVALPNFAALVLVLVVARTRVEGVPNLLHRHVLEKIYEKNI